MADAFGELGERLADISDAAAECRLLRHAWPRKTDPRYRALTSIVVLARNRRKQPTRIERRMACAAGCGVVKTITIAVDPKTMRAERVDSTYDYRETDGRYLLKPRDANGRKYTDHIDRDEVGFGLMARLYPELQW